MRKPVDILLRLTSHVPCDPAEAGERHRTEIDGLRAMVLLPSLAQKGDGRLGAPIGVSLQDDDDHRERWGLANSGAECYPTIDIDAVVLRFHRTVDSPAELAERLGSKLRPWQSRVLEWLRTLARHPLLPRSFGARFVRETALIAGGSCQPWEPPTKFKPIHFGAPLFWSRVAPVGAWRRAIREATRGADPPLEHALMNRARAALDEFDDRIAAIEAGSACEVAITASIERRLARGDQKVARALLGRTRMLGSLIQLSRELGIALPSDIDEKLVKLRNDAVHRGGAPARGAASKAVEIAEAVIAAHSRP